MINPLITILFLCASLLAQSVRVINLSPAPFEGYVSTNIDSLPETKNGTVDGMPFTVGRKTGDRTWIVDLKVALGPNEQKTIDLSQAIPAQSNPLESLPAEDLLSFFGGFATLGGQPMDLISAYADGASIVAHLRKRTGRAFQTDVWIRWIPAQPWMARAEALVTCSNPAVSDLTETVGDLTFRLGDAMVLVPGRGLGRSLVDVGTRFADGQARAVPMTLVWVRHLKRPSDWSSVGAFFAYETPIGAVGLSKLTPNGTPTVNQNLDVWFNRNIGKLVTGIHSWSAPEIGPAATTGQTGAVEDQCHVGSEGIYRPGCEVIRYLAALKTTGHPMHHLETDGSVVTRERHPNLRLYYSRPHSSGSDKLGKPRDLIVPGETSGWDGPDAQHWTIATLAAASRYYGSPLLQKLLEHHAHNYRIMLTTDWPSVTSKIWSAREIGWEGLLVWHLYDTLEDRVLAELVVQHWRARVLQAIVPQIGDGRNVWDIRVNDARLGPGEWWIPWQQAHGAYGLYLASSKFGPPVGKEIALAAALRVFECYEKQGSRWVEYELYKVDGTQRSRSGYFSVAWMSHAAATVLLDNQYHEIARQIMNQMKQDASGDGRWIPPEFQAR